MSRCVDIHSHFFPVAILEHLRREGARYRTPVRNEADGRVFILTPERSYGPIGRGFYDLDVRRAFMKTAGIDTQVLLAPPFLFYYWLEAEAGLEIVQMENDAIADVARGDPEHFVGFATVPLQDVRLSILECERVRARGLRGIEIGSNIDGVDLDALQFWPFYEAVEALGLAILIHPNNVAGPSRMREFHLMNLVGFPLDTTLAAARLIFAGVVERFPRLKICLGQAGGCLPYLVGRFDHGYGARPECRAHIPKPPSAYASWFYYDTITHSATVLRLLLDTVGVDRVMLGSDFPFDMGSRAPRSVVETQNGLDSEQRARIFASTAAEFLSADTAGR